MISYHGHSSLGVEETNRRLRDIRGQTPQDAWAMVRLDDARSLSGPFDLEIAQDFGIDALCRFRLSLVNKEHAYLYAPELVGRLHQAFAPSELVLTWKFDSIIERKP